MELKKKQLNNNNNNLINIINNINKINENIKRNEEELLNDYLLIKKDIFNIYKI